MITSGISFFTVSAFTPLLAIGPGRLPGLAAVVGALPRLPGVRDCPAEGMAMAVSRTRSMNMYFEILNISLIETVLSTTPGGTSFLLFYLLESQFNHLFYR